MNTNMAPLEALILRIRFWWWYRAWSVRWRAPDGRIFSVAPIPAPERPANTTVRVVATDMDIPVAQTYMRTMLGSDIPAWVVPAYRRRAQLAQLVSVAQSHHWHPAVLLGCAHAVWRAWRVARAERRLAAALERKARNEVPR